MLDETIAVNSREGFSTGGSKCWRAVIEMNDLTVSFVTQVESYLTYTKVLFIHSSVLNPESLAR